MDLLYRFLDFRVLYGLIIFFILQEIIIFLFDYGTLLYYYLFVMTNKCDLAAAKAISVVALHSVRPRSLRNPDCRGR
jgi:hypothetical protein